ncbi:MAG: ATP-dependent DNA helicase [Tissierellia bacterium]|nr:ATP-dependent DNA helicase [Tissierellia bacterium]
MNEVKISVRSLIEFVGRSGDIDQGFFSNARALEGISAHKKVQKAYQDSFQREVFLRTKEKLKDILFIIEGRADGISHGEDVIVDEIKSTTRPLDELSYNSNPLHWAQAKIYAYIYAKDHEISKIYVQLTYFQLETEEIKIIQESFNFSELKEFFFGMLEEYMAFSQRITEWKSRRDLSIKELKFPFPSYRKGQRELAVAVYNTIMDGNSLFTQAPTGIGKTMSTIFPGIKSLGEGLVDKIFYLVGRTTQKGIVEDGVFQLMDHGLDLKHLTLTAKEKICINGEVRCNPGDCPYAKGHFDRVNDAIIDIFDYENRWSTKTIITYAKLHQICPFEYQLDLSNFADFITGDYNYVFDPFVYLRRFFEGSMDQYLFLVDEAHNLVDRGRDMYSGEISQNELLELYDIIPKKRSNIRKYIRKALDQWDLLPTKAYYQYEVLESLNKEVEKLVFAMNTFLTKDKDAKDYDRGLELYFIFFRYQRLLEYYNEDFVTVVEKDQIKILCLDTGSIFRQILKKAKSTVYFSATLSPAKYYQQLLGGDQDSYIYRIDSPFPPEHLKVLRSSCLKTTYRYRRQNIPTIVNYLKSFSKRRGNYIFFFPSYAFMKEVYESYPSDSEDLIMQKPSMTEKERLDFLNSFTFSGNVKGFAVMGGVFSEGIDLIGDRLVGAAIVTVGIPQMSYERDILKKHYEKKYHNGYEYAYIYPGMVKVAQSGGRVIRRKRDIGALLLIDERFTKRPYRDLLPNYWKIDDFSNKEELEKKLLAFWNYWDGER